MNAAKVNRNLLRFRRDATTETASTEPNAAKTSSITKTIDGSSSFSPSNVLTPISDSIYATAIKDIPSKTVPSSPTAGTISNLAGDLCNQPDWTKGVRGIKTFRANYTPGTVTKTKVTWDPRVWEQEQGEKRRKAEEEKKKLEENKKIVQKKLKFRRVSTIFILDSGSFCGSWAPEIP